MPCVYDDVPGSWGDQSKGWPAIVDPDGTARRVVIEQNLVPYGSYVTVGAHLRLETQEYVDKVRKAMKPEETNTAATGMGDEGLLALSNLAAPGLFEHDAEHASVIGGGAAPGCAGDKCVHHTIVIEDADLQFMIAAANHVRTALAAPVSAGGLRDAVKLIANECDGIEGLGSAVIAQRLRAALAAQPAPVDDWVVGRPSVPGIYKVRGFHIGHPEDYAVVEVIRRDGELLTNLHECNSDRDRWWRVENVSDKFEWLRVDTPAQPAPVALEDAASDIPAWHLIEVAERLGAVKDSSDNEMWWTVNLDTFYAIEKELHEAVNAHQYAQCAQPAPVVGGDAEPWGYADPKSGRSIHRNLITSTVKVGALGEVGEMVDASTIYTVPLYTHPAPLLAARPGGEGEVVGTVVIDHPSDSVTTTQTRDLHWQRLAAGTYRIEAHPAQAGGESE